MGFFGYSQKELDKEYAKGVEEAKNEGLFVALAHDIADFVAGPLMDEAAQARDRGYHDYRTGKAS